MSYQVKTKRVDTLKKGDLLLLPPEHRLPSCSNQPSSPECDVAEVLGCYVLRNQVHVRLRNRKTLLFERYADVTVCVTDP